MATLKDMEQVLSQIDRMRSIASRWLATETVSAFATVGLSAGITSSLTAASKAILCFVMFMGRIGLLTALMIFRKRWNRNEDESIRYVKAEVLIG